MLTIVIPDIPRDAILTGFGMISAAITVSVRAYIAWRRERAVDDAKRLAAHDGLVDRVVGLVEKVAATTATGTEVLRANNDRLNDIEAALRLFRTNGAENPVKVTA